MCALRCALLICGLAVSLQVVSACLTKPNVAPKQCIMDYREADPYATIKNISIAVGSTHNLTCSPHNGDNMKSLVLSVAIIENNHGEEYQYMMDLPSNSQIWMNLRCTEQKDPKGQNVIHFVPAGTNYRVRFVRCSERADSYAAVAPNPPKLYNYFRWSLESAYRS